MIAHETPPAMLPPPDFGPALPRLLASVVAADVASGLALKAHRRIYPLPPLPRRRPDAELIAAIDRAGLRGRGGAGFPTARKLRGVAVGRRQPVVVVNGSEGEPASNKDGMLLTGCPQLMLDGALLAAVAIGAREVIVCIARDKEDQLRVVEAAVLARIKAREPMIPVSICDIPSRYVAGEESHVSALHQRRGSPSDADPTATIRARGGRSADPDQQRRDTVPPRPNHPLGIVVVPWSGHGRRAGHDAAHGERCGPTTRRMRDPDRDGDEHRDPVL